MTMRLVFVNNQCVQKIGGDAVHNIPNGVEVQEPQETEGVDTRRITLVNGVVTVRAMTQPETDIEDARTSHDLVTKKMVKVLFRHENRERRLYKVAFLHENRIRVLEGKAPITEAAFLTAIDDFDQITMAQFKTALENL
jgi:hypothetical protein